MVSILIGLALIIWQGLRGSLAQLDGAAVLAGLQAPVTVSRDSRGVVTIEADNEVDAVRALGFVHAQERYFEMDLARRSAAGELAALLGPAVIAMDRERRPHRMRARVAAHTGKGNLLGELRPMLDVYAAGANAGLAALAVRPWTYLVLRQEPAPWTAEDTVLAAHALYFDLQGHHPSMQLALWRLQQKLPPALFGMLTHGGSQWDAPIVGPSRGNAALPSEETLDLRQQPEQRPRPAGTLKGGAGAPGSNNLAVAGSLTADGRAIVGGDMHLGLRAPGPWFRVRLIYPDARAPGGKVDASGFSFPGIPGIIAGSTGHVAWTLTNAYAHTLQWARLPPCRGPAAQCGLSEHQETIAVAGAEPERLTVRESPWGPVLDEEPDGSLLALRWAAHLSGAVGSGLAEFHLARDLDTLFATADRTGVPVQNLVAADRNGRIGWRLLGTLPDWQAPCDRGRIVIEAGSCPAWSITTQRAPEVRDPPSGRLWTANNRVHAGPEGSGAGYFGRDQGARAQQIRDALMARTRFDESAILAIQLDDRAVFLERWWHLFRATLAGMSGDPDAERLGATSLKWEGRAAPQSVSYLMTRRFREAVERRVLAMLLAPHDLATAMNARLGQTDGWLWPLVTTKPAHLLRPDVPSWDVLLKGAVRDIARNAQNFTSDGTFKTWGDQNRAGICHPLAVALPQAAKHLLCMPDDPLPGDHDMPRVQRPGFGASQRLAVAPGHEAEGLVQMPAGQSGHPLSPFWQAGHEDWSKGKPAPFLPGPTQHRLLLSPAP